MSGDWLRGLLCACLLLALGCKTAQPNLKPLPQPEALNVPPHESRFDNSAYPKQAMVDNDPTRKMALGGPGASGMMPPRGTGALPPGMTSPGMSGAGTGSPVGGRY